MTGGAEPAKLTSHMLAARCATGLNAASTSGVATTMQIERVDQRREKAKAIRRRMVIIVQFSAVAASTLCVADWRRFLKFSGNE